VFYHKDLAETVIRAVVRENVSIVDPLVEHRNDMVKAVESSIWFDVHTKDATERIFALDMHRAYQKTRNRKRSVYYAAKDMVFAAAAHGVHACDTRR